MPFEQILCSWRRWGSRGGGAQCLDELRAEVLEAMRRRQRS